MEAMILNVIAFLLRIYYYILIARILMSWVPNMEGTSFGRILHQLTEPYLAPFRKIIPPLSMGGGYIDLSPIVAFIAYNFVESGIFWVIEKLLNLLSF